MVAVVSKLVFRRYKKKFCSLGAMAKKCGYVHYVSIVIP